MKQIDTITPLLLACRLEMAKKQAFLHTSRLALWRCATASNYAELQMMRYTQPSAQSRWSSATQDGFTAWLAAGGFAKEEQDAQKIRQRGKRLASHWGEDAPPQGKQHETA